MLVPSLDGMWRDEMVWQESCRIGDGHEVGVELVESPRPVFVLGAQPFACSFERIGGQPIGPYPALLVRGDEPGLFEHVEVLRERRERHVERLGQLRRRCRADAEPFDDRQPGGVGQRLEHVDR